MAAKKGVLVGIAAIAVIGVAAVVYFSQWPPSSEDATGAIGAAERYRAQQIADGDVILDIPGQEQFAKAVFEALTDEQKAELLSRIDETGRAVMYARFDEADAFARMSEEQQGRFVQALDRTTQERVASALRVEAADLGRMDPDALGRAVASMDAEARAEAIGRFNATQAFARMSEEQQGRFVQSLDRAAQERVASALRVEAADLGRMKADALGRAVANMDAEARAEAIGRFDATEAFAKMSEEQQGRFVQSLDRAAQERVASALRFEAADLGRMKADALGRAVANMDAEARAEAIGRFDATEAFARMSEEQQGRFVQSLDRAAQERVASALRVEAADLGRMKADALGRAVANMDTEARAEAIGRFDATEAFARMSEEQQGRFVQSLDRTTQERIASALRVEAADLGRMNADTLGRAVANMDAEARAEAIGRFDATEAFARMSAEQQGRFVQSLDRAAQQRVADAMRFEAADLGRMNADTLGRAVANMDAEARAEAIGRFDATEAFARMSEEQQGRFVQSLDRAAQQRVANALRFEAADLGRMNPDALGRAVANMDAEARAEAIGRFEANEAAFQRMDNVQRAAFADALGAKTFERAVLQAQTFNRMSEAQQRAVWDDLGRQGQFAALRYAGFNANLARADALQRNEQFERYMQERSSR